MSLPITKLVQDRMDELGVKRKAVVIGVGYKNIPRGVNKFANDLRTGKLEGLFRYPLAKFLGIDLEVFEQAMNDTAAIYKQERLAHISKQRELERANFKPHLWVNKSCSVPSPIFVVALLGQDTFLRCDLPENIITLEFPEQARIIKAAILEHYARKRGSAFPFGNILGYYYRTAYDAKTVMEFSIEGDLINNETGMPPIGQATISLTKHPV